ncbi:MAG: hypothetical protein RIM84_21700 [Alphaproteobacteria bacterium]
MRTFAIAALVAMAAALAGCQSTGSGVDPALSDFCTQNGFGRPGDANYERCLIDKSMGGRGEQLDKREIGANGT